jgi:DNA-directed RNA polymerase specialized sigma24 family protein
MSYTVRAVRWAHGWELHIDGEGVTQCRTLDQADQQVRDYLATVHDTDFDDAEIVIVPDLDGYEDVVSEVREKVQRASELQVEAARDLREVTRHLRDQGLSVTDTAAVLGVSRGRVSQLVS